jgi:hypothetical protein
VERESLTRAIESGGFDGLAEAFANVAVVESASECVAEDEVVVVVVRGGVSAFAEERGEDDLPTTGGRFQFRLLAFA